MKKYLSLIAVLALLVACMIPSVFAADIYANVGTASVDQGTGTAVVKVPVSVEGTSIDGFTFSNFKVSEGAKIVDVTTPIPTMFFYTNGAATLIYADTNNNHLTGTVLYIHVEVPTDKIAEYEVTFDSAKITSVENNLSMHSISVSAGKVVINHTCVPGGWVTVKEPTCTEDGLKVNKCSLCGEPIMEQVIPATGHKAGDWTVVTEPDCVNTGLKVQKCSVCGEKLAEEVIPALGHKEVEIPAVAPTCTETGLTAGKKCSVCNEILVKQEVVAALGHAWDKGVVGNEGAYDCPDEFLIQTCANCGETQEVANGHECDETKAIPHTVSNVYDEEKKVNIATIEYRCEHSLESAHGCSTVFRTETKEIEDPKTGDITPYIAMGALTLVAIISAAGYMLKRKAI